VQGWQDIGTIARAMLDRLQTDDVCAVMAIVDGPTILFKFRGGSPLKFAKGACTAAAVTRQAKEITKRIAPGDVEVLNWTKKVLRERVAFEARQRKRPQIFIF